MDCTLQDLIRSETDIDANGCWVWKGYKLNTGYGRTYAGRYGRSRYVSTHRLAYEVFFGPIPEGQCVLHRCDNRPCCNPAHLFLGTRGDNNADRQAKGRNADRQGERNTQATLTAEQVIEARSSSESVKTLAQRFGVSESGLSVAISGKTWAHLPKGRKRPPSFKVFFDGHQPRETAHELRRLYEQGVSADALAERFGCTRVTVSNALTKLGVEMRKGGSPAREIRINGNVYPTVNAAMKGERMGYAAIIRNAEG